MKFIKRSKSIVLTKKSVRPIKHVYFYILHIFFHMHVRIIIKSPNVHSKHVRFKYFANIFLHEIIGISSILK